MLIFKTPQDAQQWRNELNDDLRVGLVPTMGALHEGHAQLVRQSTAENDITIVSIFVNPLQFNDKKDFDAYPNTFDSDCALLESLGVDAVFTGSLEDFFPNDPQVSQPGLAAKGLEGAYREGHFEGVRTIVKALFEYIHPDVAYFGQKDLQQTYVVRELAEELGYPQIVIVPTVRDTDGLALSSRNQRLSVDGRQQALGISQTLKKAQDSFRSGERDARKLECLMHSEMLKRGLEPEYCAVRNAGQWTEESPEILEDSAYALIAAYVDGVRLIDNMLLSDK